MELIHAYGTSASDNDTARLFGHWDTATVATKTSAVSLFGDIAKPISLNSLHLNTLRRF